MSRVCVWLAVATIILVSESSVSFADDGHPVAIRHWPGGCFTIESMWGIHVGFGLNDEAQKALPRKVDFDAGSMKSNTMTIRRQPNRVEIESSESGFASGDDIGLDNLELELQLGLKSSDSRSESALNEFEISKWKGAITAEVDGFSVVNLNSLDVADFQEMKDLLNKTFPAFIEDIGGVKELRLCFIATDEKFDAEFLKAITSVAKPEIVIVRRELKTVGESVVEPIGHNTVAVSASSKRDGSTRFVSLTTEPYKLSDELTELFEKKEIAQKSTMDMFSALSVEQMNFEPSNGSHTPRWNAEHMMGRELGFFSQIYNAMDSAIPVMNLNPKQMPKDYEFAHPDWSGKEEARQIERVQDFTRRFAYLLDGMDLDKKAPGSFWTPRKLLLQMDRHYNEHSGNVRKKMKLAEWPKQKTESKVTN